MQISKVLSTLGVIILFLIFIPFVFVLATVILSIILTVALCAVVVMVLLATYKYATEGEFRMFINEKAKARAKSKGMH